MNSSRDPTDILQDLKRASEKWRDGCYLLDRAIASLAINASLGKSFLKFVDINSSEVREMSPRSVLDSSFRSSVTKSEGGIRWNESEFLLNEGSTGSNLSVFSVERKATAEKRAARKLIKSKMSLVSNARDDAEKQSHTSDSQRIDQTHQKTTPPPNRTQSSKPTQKSRTDSQHSIKSASGNSPSNTSFNLASPQVADQAVARICSLPVKVKKFAPPGQTPHYSRRSTSPNAVISIPLQENQSQTLEQLRHHQNVQKSEGSIDSIEATTGSFGTILTTTDDDGIVQLPPVRCEDFDSKETILLHGTEITNHNVNKHKAGSEHETILSVVQEGSESNIVPVHNHHLTRLLEPKRLLASSPEASRRAGSPPPGISFQQTTPVDTAPPQSALLKTFHILVNRGQEWIRFLTLIPAFGSNGQLLSKEFDAKDISELSFLANGMHPKSYFNTICDLIIIIQFIVVVWFVPFLVAYQEDDGIRHLVSGVLSILFAVNTAISGVTPISKVSNTIICTVAEYEEQRPSLSTWIKEWIIKKETWLAILTTIPFDVIFSSLPHSKLLLLIRLLGVFKMAEAGSRCALWQCMNQCLDKAAGMPISNIFSIAYGMIIFIHINACEMYYLGTLSGFVGWETAFFHIHDASTFDFYAWTFLQSVSHMFPNSFIPQTATEQLMGSVFNVFGAVLYASFIGAISNAVMSVNPAGRLYSQKMEQLNDYVKWKNLATDTEKKLFKFYETKYRGKYFDEDLLLTEMNESLRAEICLENTRDLIEKVPFMRRAEGDGRDEIFIGRLATALRPQYYVKGDYITKQGDAGMDMFFIRSGKMDVFVNERKVVSLYDGAYVGEVALITHVLRTASVQAVKPSVLYRLSKQDFHLILEDFSDMKTRIDRLALERLQALYDKR